MLEHADLLSSLLEYTYDTNLNSEDNMVISLVSKLDQKIKQSRSFCLYYSKILFGSPSLPLTSQQSRFESNIPSLKITETRTWTSVCLLAGSPTNILTASSNCPHSLWKTCLSKRCSPTVLERASHLGRLDSHSCSRLASPGQS